MLTKQTVVLKYYSQYLVCLDIIHNSMSCVFIFIWRLLKTIHLLPFKQSSRANRYNSFSIFLWTTCGIHRTYSSIWTSTSKSLLEVNNWSRDFTHSIVALCSQHTILLLFLLSGPCLRAFLLCDMEFFFCKLTFSNKNWFVRFCWYFFCVCDIFLKITSHKCKKYL